jgi:zinc protease
MDGFEPGYLDERNGKIAAVGLGDARRAATKLLGDGELLVTMVGRPEGI